MKNKAADCQIEYSHIELFAVLSKNNAFVVIVKGHGGLGPDVVEAIHYIDMAYLTIYPFDKLYDPVFGRLLYDAERQGDWLVLQGTIEPHSEVLDEVELEVRLKVQARDTALMVRGEVWQGQSE